MVVCDLPKVEAPVRFRYPAPQLSRYSSVVEHYFRKVETWVRFPPSALFFIVLLLKYDIIEVNIWIILEQKKRILKNPSCI